MEKFDKSKKLLQILRKLVDRRLRSLANAQLLARGLSASVSFLPLPLPPLSFFGSRLISRAIKTENLLPRSLFTPKPNGNAYYAGYVYVKATLSCTI